MGEKIVALDSLVIADGVFVSQMLADLIPLLVDAAPAARGRLIRDARCPGVSCDVLEAVLNDDFFDVLPMLRRYPCQIGWKFLQRLFSEEVMVGQDALQIGALLPLLAESIWPRMILPEAKAEVLPATEGEPEIPLKAGATAEIIVLDEPDAVGAKASVQVAISSRQSAKAAAVPKPVAVCAVPRKLKYEVSLPGKACGLAPGLRSTTVVVAFENGKIALLDYASGRIVKDFIFPGDDLLGDVLQRLLRIDNAVVVLDAENRIHWLNIADLKQRKQQPVKLGGSVGSLVGCGKIAYATVLDGDVYRITRDQCSAAKGFEDVGEGLLLAAVENSLYCLAEDRCWEDQKNHGGYSLPPGSRRFVGGKDALIVGFDKELLVLQAGPDGIREGIKIRPDGPAWDDIFLSPDGKLCLVSVSNLLHVYNAQTGEAVASLEADKKGWKAGVHLLAFSDDGKHLMTIGKDRVLRVWEGTYA